MTLLSAPDMRKARCATPSLRQNHDQLAREVHLHHDTPRIAQ